MIKRYLAVIIGSSLVGFGVSISIASGLGTDPLSLMYTLMADVTKTNLGIGNLVISAIMLSFTLIFNRKLIGVGTFLCPLFISLAISYLGVNAIQSTNFIIRFLVLLIGLLVISFGTSLYIIGDLGTSPYDSSILMISHMIKQSYGKAKMILDALFIFLFYLYFKRVDIAPFIAVIVIGPLIDVCLGAYNRLKTRRCTVG